MKRRLSYFFSRDDEAEVSASLCAEFPMLKFIDGQRWPTSTPPTAEGIHRCKSCLVYLWPSGIVPELPSAILPPPMRLSGNMYQGPSSGPVIQFIRCMQRDGQLEMGQLSVFIEDVESPLGKSHTDVITFLRRRFRCPLACYGLLRGELRNERVGGYLVGRSLRGGSHDGLKLMLAFGRDEHMVPLAS